MPTPADQSLLELLDKWLKSLELHERYAGLDADSYAQVQPWPEHERPSRWIVDLARQKTLALRAQVEERIKRGDTQFSEALDLMIFLANLVGSEHIERFIPLATPENERPLKRATPARKATPARREPALPASLQAAAAAAAVAASEAAAARVAAGSRTAAGSAVGSGAAVDSGAAASARAAAASARRAGSAPAVPPSPPDTAPTQQMPMAPITSDLGSTGTREMPGVSVTATREMPQFAAGQAPAPAPVGTAQVARTERRAPTARPAGGSARGASSKTSGKHPARMPAAARQPAAAKGADTGSAAAATSGAARDRAREQVIADAVRLTQWGRKWFELAELIARMADRPPLPEVRRILKDNKTAIEKKAGRG